MSDHKINFLDKLNATVLSLVTPEMKRLNEVRKKNNYPSKPTFDRPNPMLFEYEDIKE